MTTIVDTRSSRRNALEAAPGSRDLFRLGLAILALNAVAAAVAVSQRWPAAFGVTPDPDHVAQTWLVSGTAISAPVAPLVVLVVFIVLANARSRRLRVAGNLGSLLVSVLFVIGELGEPTLIRPESPLEAAFHAAGLVLALGLLGTAGAGLVRLRAAGRDAQPA